MSVEIIVALIGLAGVIFSGVVSLLVKQYTKNRQYEKEIRFRADVLTLKINLYDWNVIQNELAQLMETTEIDRFLILNAFNGKDDPRWTTAIYQLRGANSSLVNYVHVELDEDYISRLKRIKQGSPLDIVVNDLPESLIKSVYKAEEVNHSIWFHIRDKELDDSETVGISYCSFATHKANSISESAKVSCKRIVDMIQGAVFQAESEK